ncbi:unnamed protein product [Caenorhabditis bovis]|uniref:Uncharacterized protein n=1 Tax=Caenorhabditis bovis TaxID=2654633 RepID=A0A8S1ENB8_9PELO|nr:unnamed protein product [Caenorhabditis bovis]
MKVGQKNGANQQPRVSSISKRAMSSKRQSATNCTKNDVDESLPVYSVEESKNGQLINRQKRLIWPCPRPFSKKEFEKRCGGGDNLSCSSSFTNCATLTDLSTTTTTKSEGDESPETDAFVGGATSSNAQKLLGHRSFVLYYRMPDDGTIPLRMPLMLVYKSTNNIYYHFTISERKQYDPSGHMTKKFFKVECGDSLEFLSMEALIRHYETFVYHDVWTGSMESFPVGTREGAVYDVYK